MDTQSKQVESSSTTAPVTPSKRGRGRKPAVIPPWDQALSDRVPNVKKDSMEYLMLALNLNTAEWERLKLLVFITVHAVINC